LTFATHFAASLASECQIQNSTRNLWLPVVIAQIVKFGFWCANGRGPIQQAA
jgi:hypothetical protein